MPGWTSWTIWSNSSDYSTLHSETYQQDSEALSEYEIELIEEWLNSAVSRLKSKKRVGLFKE